MENSTKVLIKIHDNETDADKWVHLCYIDSDLFSKFVTVASEPLNEYIREWARVDFKEALSINSTDDILKLKALIFKFYKHKYPELCRESKTDRQGWVRVWITSRLKEELGIED